jgi:hypothetical protein
VKSLLGGIKRDDPHWQWEGEPAYFGWGLVGFGRVGVLGFNPDTVRGASAAGRQRLWRQCINPLMGDRVLRVGAGSDGRLEMVVKTTKQYSRTYPGDTDFNNSHLRSVLGHLMDIRQLRPLSGWVVVGLLGALALLIGPVDYFLLKRLNRQPWTHVTMLLYLALFTGGAYFGVLNYRAGNGQVRAVTVTDAVQGLTAWTTTYAGVFASEGAAYGFRPAAQDSWWCDLSPMSDEPYGRRGLADKTLDCWQGDGSCRPGALSIRVWTMQSMIGEWPCRKLPLKVTATRQNDDVQVKVENLADLPVEVLALAGAKISSPMVIAPHESSATSIAAVSSESDSGSGNLRGSGYASQLERAADPIGDDSSATFAALRAGSCGQRRQAMADMVHRGDVVVIARYKDSPMPFDVSGAQLDTNHVEFVRVVAKVSNEQE